MFLGNDQQVFTLHLNEMVNQLGRKIMTGDVIELPHMREDMMLEGNDGEDQDAVNQYWVVQEATKDASGFDPGWWPHIWRVRCKQLQDTQEYKDILGTGEDADDLKNILSTYNKELQITDAVVQEAQDNVPGKYWDYRTNNLMYATPGNHPDDIDYATVAYGKAFPESPTVDSYFLRTDYTPSRLFQYRDSKWYRINDDDGAWEVGHALHNQFINNAGTVKLDDGTTLVGNVNLSKAVRPKVD